MNMKFTPEQLEILTKGFQGHDFTQDVYLPGGMEKPEDEPKRTYNPLEKRVLRYMKRNLPALGFKRNMNNFTEKHPVNVLMSADARYISDEAMKILRNEEHTEEAIKQYMELFGPLIEFVAESYCEAKRKTLEELDDNDVQRIMDRVTSVVNEELMNAVMQGQRFPAINDIAHTNLTHEDFGNKVNFDSINFHEQWTRCDTQVQELLSLDAELGKESENDDLHSTIEPGYEVDFISQALLNSFCETLDDIDTTIFHTRMDGRTYVQIAEKLGYKTHSAVLKRVEKIGTRWKEFMSESKPK
ncbi:MAG: hypothetical protein ACI4O3_00240 [Oscillospiraceae bacterium]